MRSNIAVEYYVFTQQSHVMNKYIVFIASNRNWELRLVKLELCSHAVGLRVIWSCVLFV